MVEEKKVVKTYAQRSVELEKKKAKKDNSEMRILEEHKDAEIPYRLCQIPGRRGRDGKVTEWRTVTKVIYD